jgi:hypothetical protein
MPGPRRDCALALARGLRYVTNVYPDEWPGLDEDSSRKGVNTMVIPLIMWLLGVPLLLIIVLLLVGII